VSVVSSFRPRKSVSESPAPSIAGPLVDDRDEVSVARIEAAREHIPESGQFPVVLVCGNKAKRVELDLYADGEIFFETLQGYYRKMLRNSSLELDRKVYQVIFSNCRDHLDIDGNSFEIGLMEDQMASGWQSAVRWVRDTREKAPEDDIYAILEQEGG
jgi:hypothetical protein